jgi:tetratricopeptide (TPR) repeat protein
MTIYEAMAQGLQHFQAGRLGDAEAAYRQILAQNPSHADALGMMGKIAYQAGRAEVAAALFSRAAAIQPTATAYCDLGTALAAMRKLDEAIAAYQEALLRRPDDHLSLNNLGHVLLQKNEPRKAAAAFGKVLALRPDDPQVHNDLGNALRAAGALDDAIRHYRQARTLAPDLPESHNNLGAALFEKKDLQASESACRGALQLRPDFPQALVNLGNVLSASGKPDEAVTAYERAITQQPNFADAFGALGSLLFNFGRIKVAIPLLHKAVALNSHSPLLHHNLAMALARADQVEEAIASYRKALELRPMDVDVMNHLGVALTAAGRLDDAISCFSKALSVKPEFTSALSNLADALRNQGNVIESETCLRQALKLQPDLPAFHWNLGVVLLLRGKFEEGWKEFAWRDRALELKSIRRGFSQPQWDGSDLGGRTILLHAEQGFGDTLQFVRYLPMVKQRGGRILFGCDPSLHQLFHGQFAVDEWEMPGHESPKFEVHCPLLNLPMVFGTTLQTIPSAVPYLAAPPESKQKWAERLAGIKGIKVGLAWAGSPKQANNRNRSIPPEMLSPLQIQGVTLISLQKGTAAKPSPGSPVMIDWTEELTDFAETAGLIANLDLAITVDTSIAHLAGAMGKPVWVMLCFAPDWRWLLDREDSPWYPTTRLFRQPNPGDWQSVVGRVKDALLKLTKV